MCRYIDGERLDSNGYRAYLFVAALVADILHHILKDGLTAGLRIPVLREGRSHPDNGDA